MGVISRAVLGDRAVTKPGWGQWMGGWVHFHPGGFVFALAASSLLGGEFER